MEDSHSKSTTAGYETLLPSRGTVQIMKEKTEVGQGKKSL